MVDEYSDTSTASIEDTSNGRRTMLARTWTIAANFREPADYGIPTAPTFCAEHRSDETLVLFASSDAAEPFITAEGPMTVRR